MKGRIKYIFFLLSVIFDNHFGTFKNWHGQIFKPIVMKLHSTKSSQQNWHASIMTKSRAYKYTFGRSSSLSLALSRSIGVEMDCFTLGLPPPLPPGSMFICPLIFSCVMYLGSSRRDKARRGGDLFPAKDQLCSFLHFPLWWAWPANMGWVGGTLAWPITGASWLLLTPNQTSTLNS